MGDLGFVELAAAAEDVAALAGCRHASLRALDNERPFKFGQSAHDVKHQLPTRRRGVDSLGQRLELAAARVEAGDQLDQVRQRPTEAIEPPCDQHIPLLHGCQGLIEARAALDRPRDALIFKDHLAPCPSQRVSLEGEVLIVRTDPRIADFNAMILQRDFATRNRLVLRDRQACCKIVRFCNGLTDVRCAEEFYRCADILWPPHSPDSVLGYCGLAFLWGVTRSQSFHHLWV